MLVSEFMKACNVKTCSVGREPQQNTDGSTIYFPHVQRTYDEQVLDEINHKK